MLIGGQYRDETVNLQRRTVDTPGMWSILAPAVAAVLFLSPLPSVVAQGTHNGADRAAPEAPLGPPPPPGTQDREAIPEEVPQSTVSEAAAVDTLPDGPARSGTFRGHQVSGYASWYGGKFQGRQTANGEIFDTNELTAAHRTLPFNTIVRVTTADGERSVVVRINDRGPFVDDRVIDLSRAAADIIGMTAAGVAPVELEILHYQEETDLRTIQIASFSRRASATAVVEGLRENGLPAAIETVASAGVHRVILQGVREGEISSYRERLRSLGYPTVLVRNK
jgi:rare lipoprotein A